MGKKRFIFILYSLSVGGAEKRAITIANYLVKKGFEIEVLLLDNPMVCFAVDERIKIVYLKDSIENITISNRVDIFSIKNTNVKISDKIRLFFLKFFALDFKTYDYMLYLKSKYVNKIYSYLKNKEEYTVVSWMTLLNLSTCEACRYLNNEIILVECTSPFLEFPDNHPANLLKKKLYPMAKKIICQTDNAASYYAFLNSTTKYVIPNPIVGSYPERHKGTRKKIVVNFCRLSKEKNIQLLIDAFRLLQQKYPDYKLYVYGDGEEKVNLIHYVSQLGLDNSVKFYGFNTNLHSEILNYAMFVSSSIREGMSNSMLEAMAIGLPTISTDCGGAARMLIVNYENGIIVPVNDKQAMYEAMDYIVEHPEKAEEMSINATRIREELSMEKIGKLWIDALSDWKEKNE